MSLLSVILNGVCASMCFASFNFFERVPTPNLPEASIKLLMVIIIGAYLYPLFFTSFIFLFFNLISGVEVVNVDLVPLYLTLMGLLSFSIFCSAFFKYIEDYLRTLPNPGAPNPSPSDQVRPSQPNPGAPNPPLSRVIPSPNMTGF